LINSRAYREVIARGAEVSMIGTAARSTRLQILQVPDCPLVATLVDQVRVCLADCGIRERLEILVGDYPSPTLAVKGVDVSTGRPVEGGSCCRFDLPSSEQIRDAVLSLR
jgi:hypothetical protein